MDHLAAARVLQERGFEAELACLHDELAKDPSHHGNLRLIFDRYQDAGLHDRACCVAEVLEVLHKTSPGQSLYLGMRRPRRPPAARRALSEPVLREHVAHPDQDPYITAVLALIAPALAAWRSTELPRSLDPSDAVDASTDPRDVSRMVQYAVRVLGVDRPDVHLRRDEQGDYALLNTHRDGRLHPTLVVFENLLRRRKEPELGYLVGRAMADLYLPHFAAVAVDRSPQALRAVLRAIGRAHGSPVEGDVRSLDQIAHEILGRMTTLARTRLSQVAQRFTASGRCWGDVDAARWMAAAECTSHRVALLLCGDVRSAAAASSTEQSPLCVPSPLSSKERREDLLRYGVSEDYFIARAALGIDVTV